MRSPNELSNLTARQIKRWEQMFEKLVRFKEIHGHCNVPDRWPRNPQLAKWVDAQRTRRKQGALPLYRYRKLIEIGFIFEVHETRWSERYAELQAFNKKRGHSNVPDNWRGNLKLAHWVTYQRTSYKQGILSQERIHKLEAIGFVWHRPSAAWEEMFSRLCRYRGVFGNCDVPYEWPDDVKLSRWVRTQRYMKRKRKLSEERARRLDGVGFSW
jgi:hypothetical protein